MKRATLLAVIFGIVVVVAVGILLAVLLSGYKPSVDDFDDDFDLTIGGTQAPPEETQAPPEETQAPPPEETEAPPEETQAPPPDIDPRAIIGLWSGQKWEEPVANLPEKYAQRAFDLDDRNTAALKKLIDDILKDSSIEENVYFYVYREDGTGYFLGIYESGNESVSFDYRVEGDVLYMTNRVAYSDTYYEDPYTDKPIGDWNDQFRIVNKDGQERLYIFPDLSNDSNYADMTIDELIETPYADRIYMIKVM